MTKPSELRELGDTEIAERIDEGVKELFNLRFDVATAQVANTSRIRTLKREVARLRTISAERARASAKAK